MSSISSIVGGERLELGKQEWEPDGQKPQMVPNKILLFRIIASATEAMDEEGSKEENESRTELDTHANMCVFGEHCFVLRWTGRNVEVSPFTPDYEALQQVPIIDAAFV